MAYCVNTEPVLRVYSNIHELVLLPVKRIRLNHTLNVPLWVHGHVRLSLNSTWEPSASQPSARLPISSTTRTRPPMRPPPPYSAYNTLRAFIATPILMKHHVSLSVSMNSFPLPSSSIMTDVPFSQSCKPSSPTVAASTAVQEQSYQGIGWSHRRPNTSAGGTSWPLRTAKKPRQCSLSLRRGIEARSMLPTWHTSQRPRCNRTRKWKSDREDHLPLWNSAQKPPLLLKMTCIEPLYSGDHDKMRTTNMSLKAWVAMKMTDGDYEYAEKWWSWREKAILILEKYKLTINWEPHQFYSNIESPWKLLTAANRLCCFQIYKSRKCHARRCLQRFSGT